jgi:hypothetical protein
MNTVQSSIGTEINQEHATWPSALQHAGRAIELALKAGAIWQRSVGTSSTYPFQSAHDAVVH